MNIMTLDKTITLFLIIAAIDFLKSLPKNSIPFILRPYIRFLKEFIYISKIIFKNKFNYWNPINSHYVALKAIKAHQEKKIESAKILDLIHSSIKKFQQIIAIGDPGCGKSTVLEAVTFKLSIKAFIIKIVFLTIYIIVAVFLYQLYIQYFLIFLASFFIWEPILCRYSIPIFIEGGTYLGESIEDWYNAFVKKSITTKLLFLNHRRLIFLIDGINEVQSMHYSNFIEGWRFFIENNPKQCIIFTSRSGENPSSRLGIKNVMNISELDDEGVKNFLRVYGQEKLRLEKSKYTNEMLLQEFEELKYKNLLSENGIGRNPYWLKMIIESGIYTQNKGKLFLNFAKKLILREIEDKPEDRKRKPYWSIVPLEIEMECLSILALEMHNEKRIGFIGEKGWFKAWEIIKNNLKDVNYSPNDIFDEADSATLIKKQRKLRIEFVHQLLQEFFTAYYLFTTDQWFKKIQEKCGDIWWWQTLFLLIGLLSDRQKGLGQEKLKQLILSITKTNNENLRIISLIGIISSLDSPSKEIIDIVLKKLTQNISYKLNTEQENGVRDLGRLLGNDVVNICTDLLNLNNVQSTKLGISLLCSLESNVAKENVIEYLKKEDITELLKEIGNPIIDLLSNTTEKSTNIEHKIISIETLGKIGGQQTLIFFFKLLNKEIKNKVDSQQPPANLTRYPMYRTRRYLHQKSNKFINIIILSILKISENNIDDLFNILLSNKIEINEMFFNSLRDIDNPATLLILQKSLKSNNYNMTKLALDTIQNIRNENIPQMLINFLDSDQKINFDISESIIDKITGSKKIDKKKLQLELEKKAIQALSKYKSIKVIETFLNLSKDSSEEVRISAFKSLSRFKDPKIIDILINSLEDKSSSIRIISKKNLESFLDFALSETENIQSIREFFNDYWFCESDQIFAKTKKTKIDFLFEYLEKQGENKRKATIAAFTQNENKALIIPMLRFLKDSNNSVRMAAAYSLGKVNCHDVIKPLINTLISENDKIDSSFPSILSKLSDIKLFNNILNKFKNRNTLVAIAASESLVRIGKPAISPMLELIKQESFIIYKPVLTSLCKLKKNDLKYLKKIINSDNVLIDIISDNKELQYIIKNISDI